MNYTQITPLLYCCILEAVFQKLSFPPLQMQCFDSSSFYVQFLASLAKAFCTSFLLLALSDREQVNIAVQIVLILSDLYKGLDKDECIDTAMEAILKQTHCCTS